MNYAKLFILHLIECSSLARAYPDCNQWFTGISGVVQSYNWPNVMLQARHFNTCIRREKGKLQRKVTANVCLYEDIALQ